MSNPLLNDKAFQSARAAADGPGWDAPNPTTRFGAPTVDRSNTMTMNGTMSATAVLFALLLLGGVVGWRAVTVREGVGAQFPTWSVLAILGALGMMLLTNFKPHLAKITGPIYAVLQGLLVGAITHAYDIRYNGIAIQAVGATTAVIGVIVLLQKTRIVKVTDRMRRIVLSATMGVFVFYMITFVLSFFGFKAQFLSDGSPLAIFLSLALAGLAAFRFLVEIDFVEKQTQMGAPKEMEWFAAFGLLASTVWLYLEILRLLANLNKR